MAQNEAKRQRDLFGHPIGLTSLFSTEMAERFSYYGMTSILIFYLTQQLLTPEAMPHVIGLSIVRSAFQWLLGPLSPTEFATNITGLYTGLVYLTPFFGGLLADRLTGQRYTVVAGGLMMIAGEFMLTQTSLFFFGLLALIIGNGAFKPNISTQVGNLYAPGDNRIDRAYSIFYVGINLGAFLAPYICGTLGARMCTDDWPASHGLCVALGQNAGWHFGFFAAGIGVSIGVLIYLMSLRHLPPDRVTSARRSGTKVKAQPLSRQDWKAIFALVALFVPVTGFWMSYEQQYITIALWARDYTDRIFIPGVVNFVIPAPWAQSIDPAMIFAFTPFLVWMWGKQARRGREPSTPIKMALGCALLSVSFCLMAGLAYVTGPHGHASWLWLLPFFTIYTLGELYLSPVGLALVARAAPVQVMSMMMGFWFIATFLGSTLGGTLATLWDHIPKFEFFLITAAIAFVSALIIWSFDRPLRPILSERMGAPLTPGPDVATEVGVGVDL